MLPLMRFRVADKSMEPAFREGDYVLANKLFFGLKEGDVVVAKREGRFVIKRVKEIRAGRYFLCGDNTGFSSRTWVGRNDIAGKLLIHIKK